MKYPTDLSSLIANLKKLPGVGNVTAERFAFQLLKWKEEELDQLGILLKELKKRVLNCPTCGCISSLEGCYFCGPNRKRSSICIVSSPKDAFAIEATHSYDGLYHIIESLLSPLDGQGLEGLRLEKLLIRIKQENISEIILALDSTLEGDATALFLKNQLEPLNLKISRLAFGLPIGSSLEYVDGGTLTQAFQGRQIF